MKEKEQEKVIKDLTKEEIEKELKKVQEISEKKGENFYSREFKKIYNGIRKSLVILNKQRNKGLTNEQAYNKAIEILHKYID